MVSASLVFQDSISNKFWNIETNGKEFTRSWGRIGTIGHSKTESSGNKIQCEKKAKQLIAAKVKKGYTETITEELITNMFIMILSGVAERKNEQEFYYREDKFSKLATIEFVEGSSDHIILRHYYENGNKKSEHEWADGKQHGKDLGWYEDGSPRWKHQFMYGKMINEERY